MCMSGTSLGELVTAVAAVANIADFSAPGRLLTAGFAFALGCGLASGFGLGASLTVGLLHFLAASLTCCSHPRLLLAAVSITAWARGTNASRGICATSAEVTTRPFLT